jgi:hypothetical protein
MHMKTKLQINRTNAGKKPLMIKLNPGGREF